MLMPTARAPFSIDEWNQEPAQESDGLSVARVTLRKTYSGDIEGTSRTEMVMCGTPEAESRAYVALERFDGSVHGRSGSFLIHHSGTQNRGDASGTWTIVPDSGVGELAGLSGAAVINIVDGNHTLTLEYELSL